MGNEEKSVIKEVVKYSIFGAVLLFAAGLALRGLALGSGAVREIASKVK
jgi:hypothetical protein